MGQLIGYCLAAAALFWFISLGLSGMEDAIGDIKRIGNTYLKPLFVIIFIGTMAYAISEEINKRK